MSAKTLPQAHAQGAKLEAWQFQPKIPLAEVLKLTWDRGRRFAPGTVGTHHTRDALWPMAPTVDDANPTRIT